MNGNRAVIARVAAERNMHGNLLNMKLGGQIVRKICAGLYE